MATEEKIDYPPDVVRLHSHPNPTVAAAGTPSLEPNGGAGGAGGPPKGIGLSRSRSDGAASDPVIRAKAWAHWEESLRGGRCPVPDKGLGQLLARRRRVVSPSAVRVHIRVRADIKEGTKLAVKTSSSGSDLYALSCSVATSADGPPVWEGNVMFPVKPFMTHPNIEYQYCLVSPPQSIDEPIELRFDTLTLTPVRVLPRAAITTTNHSIYLQEATKTDTTPRLQWLSDLHIDDGTISDETKGDSGQSIPAGVVISEGTGAGGEVTTSTAETTPLSLKFGKCVQELSGSRIAGTGTCCVCLEEKTLVEICPDRCGKGKSCETCFKEFVQSAVESRRYSVGSLPCMGCQVRLPTELWKAHADAAAYDLYVRAAIALMTTRCPECDVTFSYFVPDQTETDATRAKLIELAFDKVADNEKTQKITALNEAWALFDSGLESASDLVARVVEIFTLQRPRMTNLQDDGLDYEQEYQPPLALDANLFGMDEHLKEGAQLTLCSEDGYCTGPGASSFLLLRLVDDVEQRFALQVAYMRRYPWQRRIGCGCFHQMCWKCKTEDWHEGESCDAHQKGMLELDAQYCTGCGVPTIRTDGCTDMLCVCGTSWQWEPEDGEDDYGDDYY